MTLSQDIRDFIQSLNDSSVRYLIVGGYAVAFHGHPRYTKDIDIWVECNRENAVRIVDALRAFGFASLGLTAEDFSDEEVIVQLGYPPNRIDLFTSIPGVTFNTCYPLRIEVFIDGLKINFIDASSLRSAKKASGRPQDIADIANLE